MEIHGDYIGSTDDKTEVLAQAHSDEVCLLFRFRNDPNRPEALPSRIENCFHDSATNNNKNPRGTFANRQLMRDAVWGTIQRVWPLCILFPSITAPEVTVEIYEDCKGLLQWRICHESSYWSYLQELQLASQFIFDNLAFKDCKTVDYQELVHMERLDGRGEVTKVYIRSHSDALMVLKSIIFGSFLESRYNSKHIAEMYYHEIHALASLYQHIQISKHTRRHSYLPQDSTRFRPAQSEEANHNGTRIPLSLKAKWCFQMVLALQHIHFEAHTYHMDIKPPNFLLDHNKDLILIDFEQHGAPKHTLAPEADGSWDIVAPEEEVTPQLGQAESLGSTITYRKYEGPSKENSPWAWPKWDIFPDLRQRHPRALEAAEVFSLGRTFWLLFEQITQEDIMDMDEVVVSWKAEHIPEVWKEIAEQCMDINPNKRPRMQELKEYWQRIADRSAGGTD